MRETSIDVQAQLKALRLNGMATAWADLTEQGGDTALAASRWLVEHLLQAEDADRAMRSIAHQMKAARFPMHRDLAGFDFTVAPVDRALIQKLADLSFTQDAQNVVLVGGPGTGKPTWPRRWELLGSPGTPSECGSTPRSIWSMPWSMRRARAVPDASP